jgi:hypothetical protein
MTVSSWPREPISTTETMRMKTRIGTKKLAHCTDSENFVKKFLPASAETGVARHSTNGVKKSEAVTVGRRRNREGRRSSSVLITIHAAIMNRTRSWHEKSQSPSSVDNPVYKFMSARRTAWIAQSSLQNASFLGICSSTSAPLLIVVRGGTSGIFHAFLGKPSGHH